MNENVINEAVDNISLIKNVIEKTKESFIAFSRIFIYWGVLFIVNSIISLFMLLNNDIMIEVVKQYPVLNYIPIIITVLVAGIIYWQISKKIPLAGLEKHLMKVWILILIMSAIPAKFSFSTEAVEKVMKVITIHISSFSTNFFSLAIALIVTSMFTGYKQLKYLAAIYIGISVLYGFFNIPILTDTVVQVLYYIALPFTFLYTGFFLKLQQARGN